MRGAGGPRWEGEGADVMMEEKTAGGISLPEARVTSGE